MRVSSIRGRMTAVFALALTTVMALGCGGLIWYSRFTEEQHADAILRLSANTVRKEAEDEHSHRDPLKFIRQESEELRGAGIVASASPRRAGVPAIPASAFPVTLVGELRMARVDIGDTTMTIGIPWRRTEQRLRAQAGALIALSLFGITAGTAGSWFLVGRTLSPIERLSRVAERTPIDTLYVHLNAPSSDAEILHLVGTLNGLLDRLSQASAAQSRFYSAASHELRTPLHTLSGHLEVGLSRSRTNPEYREAMEEAYRQTARLSSLVQDLLLLTRLNTTPASPAVEPIDLTEVCDRTLSQFAAGIEDRGLRVETRYTHDADILAPSNHADMVVRNLLENAVNYTAEHGRISIAIDSSPEGVRLDIRNECPPLQIPDIYQLLEPFYRPDISRQCGTGGNGLGLAICSAVARSNQWGLELLNEPTGFHVVVAFPRSVQALSSRPGATYAAQAT